jgi:hypothetical protein
MTGFWNSAPWDGLVRNLVQLSQTHHISSALHEYIILLFKTKRKILI